MTTYNIPTTGNAQFDREMQYFAAQFQIAIQQAEKTGNYDSVYQLIDRTYNHLANYHVDSNYNFTLDTIKNNDTSEERALAIEDLANDIWNYIPDVVSFLKELGTKNIPLLVSNVKTYIANHYNDLVDDNARFEAGQTAHINVFTNDIDLTHMKASTLKLIDPTTHQPAVNNTIVVKGQGTWTVDTAHPGEVIFTPEAGFKSSPTPVQYVIDNQAGANQTAKALAPATITLNYNQPDEATAKAGEAVTQHVTGNDTGVTATTAIKLLDPTTHQAVDKLEVKEGTWTTGPTTGDVTFTPHSATSGEPAPVSYVTLDKYGHAMMESATPVSVHYPTVQDNRPTVSITGVADVNEGVGQMDYTLSLDKVSNVDTHVTVKIANGTATQGSDFTVLDDFKEIAINELNVTIPAGQKVASVYININDDTVYEGNENYSLSIDKADNAIIDNAKSQVTTTIHDDASGSTDGRDPNNPYNHEGNDLNLPMKDRWILDPDYVPPQTHDINHAPVATNDNFEVNSSDGTYFTNYNEPSDGVLANDTDIDHDRLTVTAIRTGTENGSGTAGALNQDLQGAYGTLNINSQGYLSYQVDLNSKAYQHLAEGQSAQDVFTYSVSDGFGGTDTAQLTFDVVGQNDLPSIGIEQLTLKEGQSVVLNPLANAYDADGNKVQLSAIEGHPFILGTADKFEVEHGTITVAADGTITFTAGTDFNGVTNISYSYNDGHSYDQTSVGDTITITGPNDPPIAVEDHYITHEDMSFLFNPLANDKDPDTNPLTLTHINGVALTSGTAQIINVDHGTVNVATDGKLTFVPILGFTGDTSFTYTIDDGHGGTAIGKELVTVNNSLTPNVNSAPIAGDVDDTVIEGTSVFTYNLMDSQYDRTILTASSDPNGDRIYISGIRTGSEEGTGTVGTVGQTLEGAYGHLKLTYDGQYEYSADKANVDSDQLAKDIFTYTITDGKGGFDNAELTFYVEGSNLSFQPIDDRYQVSQNSSLTLNPLSNDILIDRVHTTLTQINDVAITPNTAQTIAVDHGTVNIGANGTITFQPTAGYVGESNFSYTITDSQGKTATANEIITIAKNHEPIASDDYATMYYAGYPISSEYMSDNDGVLKNQTYNDYIHTVADKDLDGDHLSVTAIRTGTEQGTGTYGIVGSSTETGFHGSWLKGTYGYLFIADNGDFSYSPGGTYYDQLVDGQYVQDIFTYTVSDGKGGTDTAQLTINVLGAYQPIDPYMESYGMSSNDEVTDITKSTSAQTTQFSQVDTAAMYADVYQDALYVNPDIGNVI